MSDPSRSKQELVDDQHIASTPMIGLTGLAYRRRNERPWTMVFVNENSQQVTGYAPEDLIENHRVAYGELIHPDDRETVWTTIQDALKDGCAFHVAYRLTAAGGEEKWVYDQGRGVHPSDDDGPAVEGFITDITKLIHTEEALRRRIGHLEALQDIGLDLIAERDSDDLLHAIVSRAMELLEADASALGLYRPEEGLLEFAATIGDPAPSTGTVVHRGDGVSGQVLESRKPILVEDCQSWTGKAGWERQAGQAAVIGVPVFREDDLLGVLEAIAGAPGAFSQEDADTLNALARRAAVAMENARLYEEATLRVKHQATVNRIAHAVSQTLDLDALTEILHREIEAAFAPDAFFIALYDEERDELNYRLQVDHGMTVPPERIPLGSGLTASVISQQEPLLIRDFEKERALLPPGELWGTMETPASWLGVPMRVGDRTIGVICVQAYRREAYCEIDQQLLSTIAEQVGIAVENARLYEETRHRLAQTQVLRQFMLSAASTLEFDQVLERTLSALHTTVGVEFIGFAMPSPDERSLKLHPSCIGFSEERRSFPLERDASVCGDAYVTGKPIVRGDVGSAAGLRPGVPETRSELAVPVSINGQVMGVLSVESPRPDAFDEQDLDFYSTIASQLSIALENARLFQAEREQRQQTEALEEAAAVVNGTLDLDQVLDRILEQVERVIDGDAFNIMLIEDDDTARVVRRRGYDREDWGVLSLSFGQYPLLLEMIETGGPVVVPDTAADADWIRGEGQEQWRSYIGVPIKVGGVIVGFLNVNSIRPSTFTHSDAQRLQAFANHVATAIENAQLYQELHNHADALEERVRERTSQLRTQYAQLETILDSTADGIVLASSDGELILANPVAREWLRQALSPEESDQLWEAVRALAAKAEKRPEILLELTGLDLQLTAAPVRKPTIEEASAVVAIHDISHLRTLNRMKSRFVSNVSHELRTPIATIKLLVHLMQEQPDKREEYLEPLMREAEHQARLVRDILEMSRVDAGRLEIRPEPLSLNDLAEMAVVKHENRAQAQGLALQYHPMKPDPVALADRRWMMQVMDNLMSNAIRYTPEEGTIHVSTGKEVADGRTWATVTVSDTGIGIPEHELPHIFDRFFRGEQPQTMQVSGTGLGLAILKEIVELHGGRVTVESEVGEGSSFTVHLPHEPQ
ncbi:MAG: GAF domain-containing protein [Anaerolineae bacterium]